MRDTAANRLGLSVWVRLMRAHGMILKQARRSISPDLTLPQFDVLVHVTSTPRGLTSRELSRRLLVTAGNLTGIVDRLERDGLVRREAHETDGRATRIRSTPAGRRLVRQLMPRHARDIDALLRDVPRSDLKKLRALLGRLTRGIARQARHDTAPPARREAS